ncbi:toxin glutamine deamidase domain-containing protein [Nocardia sp. NPDC057227]|uniref:toxin glutamine deamidase domain-containing protein n=1 Tax=Nocardia sp. NPDC057227 TaxID=3346056 RepID=UPI00363B1960
MSLELPPELHWIGWIAGAPWPEGDEDAAFAVSAAWKTAADRIDALLPGVDRAKQATMAAYRTGGGAEEIGARFDQIRTGEQSLEELAKHMRSVSDMAFDMGTEIQAQKITIIVTLCWLVIEIALAWLFPPTAPANEAAALATARAVMMGAEQAMVKAIAAIAARLGASASKKYIYKGIRVLPTAKGWGVIGATAIKGAGEEAFFNGLVQLSQMAAGTRKEFDGQEFGLSMLGGAAGEVVGDAASKWLGNKLDGWLGGAGSVWSSGARGAGVGAFGDGIGGIAGSIVATLAAGQSIGDALTPESIVGGFVQGGLVGGVGGVRGFVPLDGDFGAAGGAQAEDWLGDDAEQAAGAVPGPAAITEGNGEPAPAVPRVDGSQPRGGPVGTNDVATVNSRTGGPVPQEPGAAARGEVAPERLGGSPFTQQDGLAAASTEAAVQQRESEGAQRPGQVSETGGPAAEVTERAVPQPGRVDGETSVERPASPVRNGAERVETPEQSERRMPVESATQGDRATQAAVPERGESSTRTSEVTADRATSPTGQLDRTEPIGQGRIDGAETVTTAENPAVVEQREAAQQSAAVENLTSEQPGSAEQHESDERPGAVQQSDVRDPGAVEQNGTPEESESRERGAVEQSSEQPGTPEQNEHRDPAAVEQGSEQSGTPEQNEHRAPGAVERDVIGDRDRIEQAGDSGRSESIEQPPPSTNLITGPPQIRTEIGAQPLAPAQQGNPAPGEQLRSEPRPAQPSASIRTGHDGSTAAPNPQADRNTAPRTTEGAVPRSLRPLQTVIPLAPAPPAAGLPRQEVAVGDPPPPLQAGAGRDRTATTTPVPVDTVPALVTGLPDGRPQDLFTGPKRQGASPEHDPKRQRPDASGTDQGAAAPQPVAIRIDPQQNPVPIPPPLAAQHADRTRRMTGVLTDANGLMVGADPSTDPAARDAFTLITGESAAPDPGIDPDDAAYAHLAMFLGHPSAVTARPTADPRHGGLVRLEEWLGAPRIRTGSTATLAQHLNDIDRRVRAMGPGGAAMVSLRAAIPGDSTVVNGIRVPPAMTAFSVIFPPGATEPLWCDPIGRQLYPRPPVELLGPAMMVVSATTGRGRALVAPGTVAAPGSGLPTLTPRQLARIRRPSTVQFTGSHPATDLNALGRIQDLMQVEDGFAANRDPGRYPPGQPPFVRSINGPGLKGYGGNTNCNLSVLALLSTMIGKPDVAGPMLNPGPAGGGVWQLAQVQQWLGASKVSAHWAPDGSRRDGSAALDAAYQAVLDGGPGSFAYVGINWHDRDPKTKQKRYHADNVTPVTAGAHAIAIVYPEPDPTAALLPPGSPGNRPLWSDPQAGWISADLPVEYRNDAGEVTYIPSSAQQVAAAAEHDHSLEDAVRDPATGRFATLRHPGTFAADGGPPYGSRVVWRPPGVPSRYNFTEVIRAAASTFVGIPRFAVPLRAAFPPGSSAEKASLQNLGGRLPLEHLFGSAPVDVGVPGQTVAQRLAEVHQEVLRRGRGTIAAVMMGPGNQPVLVVYPNEPGATGPVWWNPITGACIDRPPPGGGPDLVVRRVITDAHALHRAITTPVHDPRLAAALAKHLPTAPVVAHPPGPSAPHGPAVADPISTEPTPTVLGPAPRRQPPPAPTTGKRSSPDDDGATDAPAPKRQRGADPDAESEAGAEDDAVRQNEEYGDDQDVSDGYTDAFLTTDESEPESDDESTASAERPAPSSIPAPPQHDPIPHPAAPGARVLPDVTAGRADRPWLYSEPDLLDQWALEGLMTVDGSAVIGADPRTNPGDPGNPNAVPWAEWINPDGTGNELDTALSALSTFWGDPQTAAPLAPGVSSDGAESDPNGWDPYIRAETYLDCGFMSAAGDGRDPAQQAALVQAGVERMPPGSAALVLTHSYRDKPDGTGMDVTGKVAVLLHPVPDPHSAQTDSRSKTVWFDPATGQTSEQPPPGLLLEADQLWFIPATRDQVIAGATQGAEPPPIPAPAASRPIGPGGYRPAENPQYQRALERATTGPDGPIRYFDPASFPAARLINGPGTTEPGRTHNCPETVLNGLSTWFGNPGVAAATWHPTTADRNGMQRLAQYLGSRQRRYFDPATPRQHLEAIQRGMARRGPRWATVVFTSTLARDGQGGFRTGPDGRFVNERDHVRQIVFPEQRGAPLWWDAQSNYTSPTVTGTIVDRSDVVTFIPVTAAQLAHAATFFEQAVDSGGGPHGESRTSEPDSISEEARREFALLLGRPASPEPGADGPRSTPPSPPISPLTTPLSGPLGPPSRPISPLELEPDAPFARPVSPVDADGVPERPVSPVGEERPLPVPASAEQEPSDPAPDELGTEAADPADQHAPADPDADQEPAPDDDQDGTTPGAPHGPRLLRAGRARPQRVRPEEWEDIPDFQAPDGPPVDWLPGDADPRTAEDEVQPVPPPLPGAPMRQSVRRLYREPPAAEEQAPLFVRRAAHEPVPPEPYPLDDRPSPRGVHRPAEQSEVIRRPVEPEAQDLSEEPENEAEPGAGAEPAGDSELEEAARRTAHIAAADRAEAVVTRLATDDALPEVDIPFTLGTFDT